MPSSEAGLAVLIGAVLFGHSLINIIFDDDNTPVLEEGNNRPVVAVDNTKLNNATEDRSLYAASGSLVRECSVL